LKVLFSYYLILSFSSFHVFNSFPFWFLSTKIGQFRFDIERKEIRLMFEQIQPSDWTTFDLNLDIEITCDNGEIFTSRVIFQDQRRASSTISIGDSAKLPTQIRIDPKNKYLFSLQMNPGLQTFFPSFLFFSFLFNKNGK